MPWNMIGLCEIRCPNLHICMIAQEFPPKPGGVGSYVYNLSKKLLERGHEVTVMTRGSTNKTVKDSVDGIDLFKVSYFPLYPFHIGIHGAFINGLLKSLEPKPTLIHLHTPLVPSIKTSLPVVTTVHTPMKVDARFHEIIDFFSLAEHVQSRFVYPIIEKRTFRVSKKITAVSFSVARELGEYGLDLKRITVVGNGVDEKTFVPLRKKKCLEQYVLYTGILRARKGLFDLIECAKHVCEVRPDVKFLICGTGPFLSRLEEEVRKTRLQNQVIFLGHVTRKKLVQTYQNATVHVVPSHYEGLPTVLLEAMSCGVPVVATNVGGNSEVISPGVNGFLVPARSPRELAKVVLELLDDVALRDRLGRAARKTVEEHFTWDRIADKILQCYESIL
jgi:glycosyltransferase involved in cell wall biosynthesis